MLDADTRAELRRMIDAARRAVVCVPDCRFGDDGERHGTHLGYTGGCRCVDCKDGHAAYKRRMRAGLRA